MAITVNVGKLPGRMTPVAVEDGASVRDALAAAGLDATGFEVRLNSDKIDDLGGTVAHGDSVYLAQKIKGN